MMKESSCTQKADGPLSKRFRITSPSWSAVVISMIVMQFSPRTDSHERAKLWKGLLPTDPRLRGEFWSDLFPQLVGSLLGLIVTAMLVSLIVYWLSRRSQRAATITFCAVVSLITLGGTAEQDKWMCFLGVLIAASVTAIAIRGLSRASQCV